MGDTNIINYNEKVLLRVLSFLKKELYSRWWILLTLFIIVFGKGGYDYKFKEKEYNATYSICMSGGSNSLSQLSSMAASFGFGGSNESAFLTLEKFDKVLNSDCIYFNTLLTPVNDGNGKSDLLINHFIKIYKIDETSYFLKNPCTFKVGDKLESIDKNGIKIMRKFKPAFYGNIEYEKPDEFSGVCSYTFKSKDELFALNSINELIKQTKTFFDNIEITDNSKSNFIYKLKLDSVENLLNNKKNILAKLVDSRIAVTKTEYLLPIEKIKEDIVILSEQFVRYKSQYEISKLSNENNSSKIFFIDKPLTPLRETPKNLMKSVFLLIFQYIFIIIAVIGFINSISYFLFLNKKIK